MISAGITGEQIMDGIIIQYEYSGDEKAWETAINKFIEGVEAEPNLADKFTYRVNILKDGVGRVHLGHWADEDTLKYLQSLPIFSEFAEAMRGLAGDSLKNSGLRLFNAVGDK
mgnify:CR=1 FL=1|jgi:hypothetical protein